MKKKILVRLYTFTKLQKYRQGKFYEIPSSHFSEVVCAMTKINVLRKLNFKI